MEKVDPLSVVVERLKSSDKKNFNDPDYELHEIRISADDFLLQYPRGAYTSARTVKRHSIMDLQGHIDRTVNSMQLINFIPKKETSSETNQDDENEEEPPHITQELIPYRDPDTFKQILLPLLRIGLSRYYEIEESSSWHIKGKGEAKVTFLVCYSFEKNRPMLFLHITPLHAPSTPKCKVEIYGEPRKSSEAKDSKWVRERNVLELSKHPGFNEILLSDSHTHNVYEGLSSNFFAVLYNPDKREPLVITAPLQYVLEGTILKIVIMVCERDKIDLQFWFPNADDVEHWEGAFITSTSRLVLPIELIKFRDGRPTVRLPPYNDTVEHIKNEVEKEITHRAYRVLGRN
ncbi:12024_t:CDS:2 [Funneliformis geosporum]|uniref:10256_t:CDS:1 n=1 Tax=Funneliformis geosporum TaxID=1117311 RepID=A0A9W4SHT9_9GLOM|nr:10256_t:CDS:2 [Funneliformis geosporum]CAI2169762.1 12024_t:CDS:2 [Funneliformis geosporum]